METTTPAKISFCTSCKNRFWQALHAVPLNLAVIEADGHSEMVLVNYNSEDQLDVWIRQFRSAIDAGTLQYLHDRSDPHFHVSKAKNLAHFAANGEFVVNLDVDNFIDDTIATYRRFWADNPDLVIHGFCGDWSDGTCGRIGMARHHFLALGGYDEEMLPMGYQDLDLLRRAEVYGLDVIRLPQKGCPAIRNGHDNKTEKVRYTGTDLPYDVMKRRNRARSDESSRIGRLVANRERKRRPVRVNFSTEVEV